MEEKKEASVREKFWRGKVKIGSKRKKWNLNIYEDQDDYRRGKKETFFCLTRRLRPS